jgi:hypothetical protein
MFSFLRKKKKKIYDKWFLLIFSTVVVCLGIGNELYKGTNASSVNLDEQRAALLETAHAYFRQGIQYQYDSYRKNLYATPEDATEQHYIYTVCSGFTFQVYYQTLGIEIPNDTESLLNYAEDNKDNMDTVVAFYKGSELIYSKDVLGTSDTPNYINLLDEWVDILKPGDIFVVTGHAMLIDSVDVKNRKITIVEAAAGASYNYVEHRENYDNNGTIQYRDLLGRLQSYYSRITSGDTLIERIAVIRFITDGNNYINNDGEKSTYALTDASISRLKYPEIDIEKIVKVHEEGKTVSQNILTNIGESITYELTIINNSDTDYDSFNVVENIDSKTTVIDVGQGEFSNNQIKWVVPSLKANESIKLIYTVEVKNDKNLLGEIIVSTGFVDNIATAKIDTLIGNKLTNTEKEMLASTYEKLKNNGQIEREFINQLYLDTYNLDIGLTELDNLDIISYDANILTGGNDVLSVKSTKVADTNVKKYIYNNFYGLRIGRRDYGDENIVDAFSQWNIYATNEINDRARTLTEDMLNDGDIVLVYIGNTDTTDKNLVNKAYIYLGGMLIRKISSTEFEKLSGDALTVFLRNIIGDNYIILRPSIKMVEQTDEFIFNDNFIIVNEENSYIKYNKVEISVNELLTNVSVVGDVRMFISDVNGKEKSNDDKVVTGDTFTVYLGSVKKAEYKIALSGDANGDGKVSLTDLVQLRKHIVSWKNPDTGLIENKTGVYFYAIDMNGDSDITLTDLVRVRKVLVGIDIDE